MMLRAMRRSTLPVVLFLGFLAVNPAAATTECSVKQTPEGFVALREAPSTTAKIIARLKPSDVVLLSQDHEPVGSWIYVAKKERSGGYGASGWVLDRLISKDDCG